MKTFHDPAELYRYYGVENSFGLDKYVYNETKCGAWCTVSYEETKTHKREVWTAQYVRSILGPILLGARRSHRKYLATADLPHDVREWFGVTASMPPYIVECADHNWLESLKPEHVDKPHEAKDYVRKVTHRNHKYYVTAVLENTHSRKELVVQLGSIIEGMDVEALVQALVFPFTSDDFRNALQAIEDEVDDARFLNSNTDDYGDEEGEA